MRTPGASCSLSHGWLKNVADTVAVPSESFTVRIVNLPRTRVRTDHRAEHRLELDVRLRAQVAHHLLELHRLLGCRCVRNGHAQSGHVLRLRLQCVDELLERLARAADAFDGDHLALADRQDRLHVEKLTRERPCTADAAAACEELERVDG